jgi:Tol biopolymer transport system component
MKREKNGIVLKRVMSSFIILFSLCFLPNINYGQETSQKEFKTWSIPNINEGAEFYFSPDGTRMVGNVKMNSDPVHQVYTFKIDGTDIKKINGIGEDACSYYSPDGKRIYFTSTKDNLEMPKGNYSDPKDYPQGAELYSSDLNGENIIRLTNNKVYDAEVSVSPDGKWILFSRQLDGKLDLWLMKPDGSEQQQITHTTDWQEGGSFFWDDETIIYRAWDINDQAQRGMPMSIFTIKMDGSGTKKITNDAGTNWAPFPAPDKEHFVFVKVLPPHNYEIFLMSMKTGKQTRLTYNDAFDGFPVLSPDGKLLSFDSSRDNPSGVRTLKPYLMDVSSLNLGPKAGK